MHYYLMTSSTFTITDQQQELIENLLENFNFDKVLTAMTALDWKWVNLHGQSGHSVPTIDRMQRQCRNLLYKSIVDTSVGSVALKLNTMHQTMMKLKKKLLP
jgi:predicted unusual protein kinase regulating ubiquinone biosynthesis (AarF/ABC1/UbiB family)